MWKYKDGENSFTENIKGEVKAMSFSAPSKEFRNQVWGGIVKKNRNLEWKKKKTPNLRDENNYSDLKQELRHSKQ